MKLTDALCRLLSITSLILISQGQANISAIQAKLSQLIDTSHNFLSPPSEPSSCFSDEFSSNYLSPVWTWFDPLHDSSYSLEEQPGYLHIATPDGHHDLDPELNTDAPRIVQSITGDFQVDIKVTVVPNILYQSAGLLVWFDKDNFIWIGRSTFSTIGIRFARDGMDIAGLTRISDIFQQTVYFRILRVENKISSYYSLDGLTWEFLRSEEYQSAPAKADAGMFVLNHRQPGWADSSISADFDYFHCAQSPAYTIAGRVTYDHQFYFDNDNPIPNVEVKLFETGDRTTTDANGYYSFTGLNPGSYTIVFPVQGGYYFWPSEYLVEVPPSATDINFIGTQILREKSFQGFDACEAPSSSFMWRWSFYAPYHGSPYRSVGIYIGGNLRSCKQEHLNAEWVYHAFSYGWKFMPIWVGPQAPKIEGKDGPCTKRNYDNPKLSEQENAKRWINSVPELAREQGLQEANSAIEAAYQLGLVDQSKSGIIIYYNVEKYDTGKPKCQEAMNAFVEGWVSQLQTLGNLAGVYGNASAVVQWHERPNPPDAVWVAAWYHDRFEGYYSHHASPYGISELPDEYWNALRIRQYEGDHYESWGIGGPPVDDFRIDSNVLDGLVVVGGHEVNALSVMGEHEIEGTLSTDIAQPSSTLIPSTPTLPSQSNTLKINDMDLLTPEQGWVLVNQRLLWTKTGGEKWTNITPPMRNDMFIEDVYFLDTLHGWVMSSQTGESNLILSTTNDGGQTWQNDPFNAFDFVEGYSAVSLDFVDPQTGWAVFKLASSSNFSFGQLFKTTNGGQTWMQLDIPSGNPVNFITPEKGWTVKGPAEEQLYITQDGGTTWELQDIVSPDSSSGYVIYNLPTFHNSQDGVIPIIRNDLDKTWIEFYITHDAGQSWKLLDTVSLEKEVTPGIKLPISIINTGNWVIDSQNSLPNIQENISQLDFVTLETGWVHTSSGVCTDEAQMNTCSFQGSFLATTNGGQTWSEIPLLLNDIYLPMIIKN